MIKSQTPCLISLYLNDVILKGKTTRKEYHIMPVVKIDQKEIWLMDYLREVHNNANIISINPIKRFNRACVSWFHDNIEGGNDIAWTE